MTKVNDGNIIILFKLLVLFLPNGDIELKVPKYFMFLILTNVKLRHTILHSREKSVEKLISINATNKVLSLLSCIVEVKKEKSNLIRKESIYTCFSNCD